METYVWLVTGGLLGWAGYAFLRFNEERGLIISMIIGALGAVVGAEGIAPMLMSTSVPLDDLRAPLLIFAVLGAAACLALGNMMYRRWGV